MDGLTVNIKGLDYAAVLAALFNASKQQGMGFLHAEGRQEMTKEEAREILTQQDSFDYLRGRVMKLTIEDDMYVGLYDRDNGKGAAARAISSVRT